MNKFQKLQVYSSIIPVFSTVFIAFVTMFVLRKHKASLKLWFYFYVTFLLFGITSFFVKDVIMSLQYTIPSIVVVGLVLAAANTIFVKLQIICTQEGI